MLKAITKAEDIVNLCTFSNLNTDMWKRQAIKDIFKEQQEEKDLKKKIMQLMPYFDLTLIEFEIKFKKRRQKFTRQQKSIVNKEFGRRYKDKIKETLGDELSKDFFESVKI